MLIARRRSCLLRSASTSTLPLPPSKSSSTSTRPRLHDIVWHREPSIQGGTTRKKENRRKKKGFGTSERLGPLIPCITPSFFAIPLRRHNTPATSISGDKDDSNSSSSPCHTTAMRNGLPVPVASLLGTTRLLHLAPARALRYHGRKLLHSGINLRKSNGPSRIWSRAARCSAPLVADTLVDLAALSDHTLSSSKAVLAPAPAPVLPPAAPTLALVTRHPTSRTFTPPSDTNPRAAPTRRNR